MKKFLEGVFGIAIVFLGVPLFAAADTLPVPIHLTVQTFDQTLFDGDVSVGACFNSQLGPTTTVNAFCAITQVASSSGWTVDASWSQYGVFVNSINTYAPSSLSGPYWLYYANGESALTGLDAHILTSGEHILLTFGISPMRVVAATTTPLIGTTTLLQAQYFDTTSFFDWVNATSSTFMVNGVPIASDANGILKYTSITTDPVVVSVNASGYVSSESVTLTPYAAPLPVQGTTVHLDIEASSSILYNNDVTVYPCFSDALGTTTTNAFCALAQAASSSGITLDYSWSAYGVFVKGINSYAPTSLAGPYWLFFADRELAQTGLDAHVLTSGEDILLTFATGPLRVATPPTSPVIGTPLTLDAQLFDPDIFDWATATNAIFTIDGVATTSDANGKITITPTSGVPIVLSITKAGYVGSKTITLTPIALSTVTTSSGGSSVPDTTHRVDAAKAVQFLRLSQNADGSFGAALYTDWVAVGLSGISGADDMRTKLKSYMLTHTDVGPNLTDVERHSMALLALGIDPSTGTSRDYISEILARFDGTQFGDANEVNDDMFALIPLTHVGYGATDAHIAASVKFIISKQGANGSWGSTDLTAAGIEALAPLETLPDVTASIARAKAYLHTVQQDDGGFGSSFATSWVLNAINGLPSEELSRDWKKAGRTPADYLWSAQQADGAVEPASVDTNSRVWATAYALTGSIGGDWNGVLHIFDRHGVTYTATSQGGSSNGEVLGMATTTSTTTSKTNIMPLLFASSTDAVVILLDTTLGTSSATSTVGKSASSTGKMKTVKTKKRPMVSELKDTKKNTAAVVNTEVVAPDAAPVEKKSGVFARTIRDPFVRFFSFFGSFF